MHGLISPICHFPISLWEEGWLPPGYACYDYRQVQQSGGQLISGITREARSTPELRSGIRLGMNRSADPKGEVVHRRSRGAASA